MKLLLPAVFAVLAVASVATWLTMPGAASDVPVILWVTDKNPARDRQVDIFHDWLVEQGYTTEDGTKAVELRLDMGNAEQTKKIIHSVSGVAGDLMDQFNGGNIRLLQAMGVLRPVDDAAAELGFGLDATYPALEPELFVDGRQYAFPANVVAHMLWVNPATFREVGMRPPPARWTVEEFERIGERWVERANAGRPRRDRFFVESLSPETLHRSMGLSRFNETMTATNYTDPRYADALRLLYRWTYELHLMPSASEQSAFATEAGYGGGGPQLFYRGNYAMMRSGRYMLIQFRKFEKPMDLAVSEPPHAGFPNTSMGTRCVTLYRGSDHPREAAWFLQYLASEAYNMQIVRDADALPPNPKYVDLDLFKYPPEHPNEWDAETGQSVHTAFSTAAITIGIGGTYSPFVLPAVVRRIEGEQRDKFMNDLLTAEHAAAETERLVEAELQRSLTEQPKLRPRYEKLLLQQVEIDRLKAEGKPIPTGLVTNPFYKRYYAEQRMLATEE